jgi:hypothetical protein
MRQPPLRDVGEGAAALPVVVAPEPAHAPPAGLHRDAKPAAARGDQGLCTQQVRLSLSVCLSLCLSLSLSVCVPCCALLRAQARVTEVRVASQPSASTDRLTSHHTLIHSNNPPPCPCPCPCPWPHSAFRDRRFPPIAEHEVPSLRCSVSLLVRYEEAAHAFDWQVSGARDATQLDSTRLTGAGKRASEKARGPAS